MDYRVHVSCTSWRINNQPSKVTSCRDNTLTYVGSCGGQIISRNSSDDVFIFNSGLQYEGLLWERYILEGQIWIWRALRTSILNIACHSMSGEIFGITGREPSVSKPKQLHVVIFWRICFLNIWSIWICFSKMIGSFRRVLNFDRLFLKLNRFSPSNCGFICVVCLESDDRATHHREPP